MGWQTELPDAIASQRPIVLDLDFDPGWKALKEQFEAKVTAQKTPAYVTRCLDAASHHFTFKSTSEFLKIAERIKDLDPAALNRTYIHFDNDIRRYDDFFIAKDADKLIDLQNSFHMAQPHISKLSNQERSQFVENFKNREKRASTFPRMVLFMPTEATRNGEKGAKGLLIGNPLEETLGHKEQEGDFVALQAVQATRKDLRDILTENRRVWITACAYVHHEKFNEALQLSLIEGAPQTKYGLLQMKVTNQNQLSTYIPPNAFEKFM